MRISERLNIQSFDKVDRALRDRSASIKRSPLMRERLHGLSSSFIVCDELAQALNRVLYDIFSLLRRRDRAATVVIRTQSADPHHIMSELIGIRRQVRDGMIPDETFHPAVYEAPDRFRSLGRDAWEAQNPALGDFRPSRRCERSQNRRRESRRGSQVPESLSKPARRGGDAIHTGG